MFKKETKKKSIKNNKKNIQVNFKMELSCQ